jgi:hypothetical protein
MGAPQILQCGETPTLTLRNVGGNLNLTGWDRPEIQVRASGDDESLEIERREDGFVLASDDDLWLQAPVKSTVVIDTVEGNASISLLLGSLTIDKIEGNAAIHSVSALSVGRIEGNVTARLIAGDLSIEKIEGNAQIAKVAGDVQLAKVEGNLALDEADGNINATVEGNVRVQTLLPPGQQCTILAEGSIVCEVPHEAGGVFALKADGQIHVTGLGEERSARSGSLSFERQPTHSQVTLQAEGNISLRGARLRRFDEAEYASSVEEEMALRSVEITQQISAQIESQVGELSRQLEDRLSRLGSNEELAITIQERVQAAMRRAEEKLAEAMRKLEQRTQESEGRRRKVTWGAPPSPPPAAPKPKRTPATDEEHMMILRMVEQGKLSVEQAEKLLAALNSKQER